MNETHRDRSRLHEAGAAAAGTLAVVFAGYVAGHTASAESAPSPAAAHEAIAPASPTPAGAGVRAARVELLVGDHVATATLADTPAAREFAAMLPITVETHDRFGQANVGALSDPLAVQPSSGVFDPDTRGLYYWSDGDQLAVYYNDIGQTVPPPGLVRLGTVDAGLDAIASAGDVAITVRPAD